MNAKMICSALIACLALGLPAQAQSKLNVVATTEDLASIAREVGGDRIDVDAIAKGYQDPHSVEAKPSFVLKLQKADVLILVGRELEIGWLPPLISQSKNAKIQAGATGYLDASLKARILDVPQGTVTRADGDVHPQGNPHFWLDPENGKIVAREIAVKFSELRPNERAYFEGRSMDFQNRLTVAIKRWMALVAPYNGVKVVTYHRSYSNFADRFGLNIVGFVEPKPGVPPSPQHTLELTNQIKRENVKLILVEPFWNVKTPDKIGADTGAVVVVLPPSVGGVKCDTGKKCEASDYIGLFDYDVNLLVNALKKAGAK